MSTLRYKGEGSWMPGYPAYDLNTDDLTDQEIETLVKSNLYELDVGDDCYNSVLEEDEPLVSEGED